MLAALHEARAFDRVDSVRLAAVLDETDTGGPAGVADLERWYAMTSAGPVRRDGVFTWLAAEDAGVEVRTVHGTRLAVPTRRRP